MSDILCKFQNSGYCKYKDNCDYKHVTEQCEEKCYRKKCMKRHQKLCRYAMNCKRQATCEYKHNPSSEEQSLKAQIKCLEVTIKELVEQNKEKSDKMAEIEKELKASLVKEVNVNKKKDSTINELKGKLKQEKETNDQQKRKLIEVENENAKKEKVIKSLREKIQSKKEEVEMKKSKEVEKEISKKHETKPEENRQTEEEKKTKCLKENCITCAIKDKKNMKIDIPVKETVDKDKTTKEKTTEKYSGSNVKVKPNIVQCKFCPKKISEGDDMEEHIKQMWPGHLSNMPRVKKKYF